MPGLRIADFDRHQFPPEVVAEAKRGRRVSVCLPARDEALTVGPIVERIVALGDRFGVIDEVLVVDDGSTDATVAVAAAAGARVVKADDLLRECGPGQGKGEALWKAVHAATGEFLVFCDADLRDFDPAFVTGLLGPLLAYEGLGFVKGRYDRPRDGEAGEGGRVTELMARPLISLLLPHLAGFAQPLGGEFAARRGVLEQVPFVQGYGVDVALLADVVELLGLRAVAQVNLGERVHRNRPLRELAPQSLAVAHAVLRRAGVAMADGSPALGPPGAHGVTVTVTERPPLIEVLESRGGRVG